MRKYILTCALVGSPQLDMREICHLITPKGYVEWQDGELMVMVHFACFENVSEVPTCCSAVILLYDAGDISSFQHIETEDISSFSVKFVIGHRSNKARQVRFRVASALGDRLEALWSEVGGSAQFSTQFMSDFKVQVVEFLHTSPQTTKMLQTSSPFYTELPDFQYKLVEVVEKLPGKTQRLRQQDIARENPFATQEAEGAFSSIRAPTQQEQGRQETEYRFGDDFADLDKSESNSSIQVFGRTEDDLLAEDLQIQQVSVIDKAFSPQPLTEELIPGCNSVLDPGISSCIQIQSPGKRQIAQKQKIIAFNEDDSDGSESSQFVKILSATDKQEIQLPVQRIQVMTAPLSPQQRLVRQYEAEEQSMRQSRRSIINTDDQANQLSIELLGSEYLVAMGRHEHSSVIARRLIRENGLPPGLLMEATQQISSKLSKPKRQSVALQSKTNIEHEFEYPEHIQDWRRKVEQKYFV